MLLWVEKAFACACMISSPSLPLLNRWPCFTICSHARSFSLNSRNPNPSESYPYLPTQHRNRDTRPENRNPDYCLIKSVSATFSCSAHAHSHTRTRTRRHPYIYIPIHIYPSTPLHSCSTRWTISMVSCSWKECFRNRSEALMI